MNVNLQNGGMGRGAGAAALRGGGTTAVAAADAAIATTAVAFEVPEAGYRLYQRFRRASR